MSQRYSIEDNPNASKNTRLPVEEDFKRFRFNRDELAHVSRYLYIAEHLIKLAKEKKAPLEVLDIGCGDVYVARTLSSSFHIKNNDIIKRYVGFDIDSKSLEKSKNNLPAMNIELVQGDITKGDLSKFNDKEFDVVICCEVIEHLKPEFVLPLLNEINRISIYSTISTPNFEGGTGSLPEDHIKEWNYSELQELFIKADIKPYIEIGVFSNLNRVEDIAKKNKNVDAVYKFLKDKMDSNFLSLTMAKFIGKDSQNILRICKHGNKKI